MKQIIKFLIKTLNIIYIIYNLRSFLLIFLLIFCNYMFLMRLLGFKSKNILIIINSFTVFTKNI
jgi:hypothetical protein